MAEKLPPSNPNNLLSLALGVRTVQDEIQHHEEHLANLNSDFYFNTLVVQFGYSRLQAKQRVNQMVTEKERIIAELKNKNRADRYMDTADCNYQD